MIRINLLADGTQGRQGGVSKAFQPGQKMTVLGSLILVLAVARPRLALLGAGQQMANIERQNRRGERREEQRLQEILSQVREFEARKAMLQQRVELIDELRKGQNAPVHMIDQVSRALPEMTWLTNIAGADGYT